MRILVNIWHFGQHHWNFARGPSDLDMETHDSEDHQQAAATVAIGVQSGLSPATEMDVNETWLL